jgi:hypothetical protein
MEDISFRSAVAVAGAVVVAILAGVMMLVIVLSGHSPAAAKTTPTTTPGHHVRSAAQLCGTGSNAAIHAGPSDDVPAAARGHHARRRSHVPDPDPDPVPAAGYLVAVVP